MTYVSQYFHRFASQTEADTAGRRVANFLAFSQSKVRVRAGHTEQANQTVTERAPSALPAAWLPWRRPPRTSCPSRTCATPAR